MTNLVVALYPEDTVKHAAERLAKSGVSGAPVVEAGRVVGVVSASDLVHAVLPERSTRPAESVLQILTRPPEEGVATGDRPVAEIMSTAVVAITPQEPISRAAALMERSGIKRLPVLDDEGYLIGIISRGDLVRAMVREYEADTGDSV